MGLVSQMVNAMGSRPLRLSEGWGRDITIRFCHAYCEYFHMITCLLHCGRGLLIPMEQNMYHAQMQLFTRHSGNNIHSTCSFYIINRNIVAEVKYTRSLIL